MNKKDNSKLLNYTTEIEPIKTASEIMGLLAVKGAQSIMIDYDKGEPERDRNVIEGKFAANQ